MKAEFKLIGLSKSKKATLERLDTDKHIFWADVVMSQDRFDALWNLCKGNWDDIKIAEVECESLSDCGAPINGKMINFRFNN